MSTYWQFTQYHPTDSYTVSTYWQFTWYQPTDSLHSINLLTVYTVSTYWQFTQYQPTDSLHGINLLTVYMVSTYILHCNNLQTVYTIILQFTLSTYRLFTLSTYRLFTLYQPTDSLHSSLHFKIFPVQMMYINVLSAISKIRYCFYIQLTSKLWIDRYIC